MWKPEFGWQHRAGALAEDHPLADEGCRLTFGQEQPAHLAGGPEVVRGHPASYDDVIRYPLSLRSVEDLLHKRGGDITHETVRFR